MGSSRLGGVPLKTPEVLGPWAAVGHRLHLLGSDGQDGGVAGEIRWPGGDSGPTASGYEFKGEPPPKWVVELDIPT